MAQTKFKKIKNVSNATIIIDMSNFNSRIIEIPYNRAATVSLEEFEYIQSIMSTFFENGKLIELGKKTADGKVVYDNKKIAEIVELSMAKFKTEVEKIDDTVVLRTLLQKCLDEGKTKKFTDLVIGKIKTIDTEFEAPLI